MSKSWKEVKKRVLANPIVKQHYDELQAEFDAVKEESSDVSTLDELKNKVERV